MLVANPRKQKLHIQVKDALGFADLTIGTGEVRISLELEKCKKIVFVAHLFIDCWLCLSIEHHIKIKLKFREKMQDFISSQSKSFCNPQYLFLCAKICYSTMLLRQTLKPSARPIA